MLNFDLAETQAGKDIFQMGEEKGAVRGKIEQARCMLMLALQARFGQVAETISKKIDKLESLETLDRLLPLAIQAESPEDFEAKLEEVCSMQ